MQILLNFFDPRRDKGKFIKNNSRFNESSIKLSHQLKSQIRGATSTMLKPNLSIYGFH